MEAHDADLWMLSPPCQVARWLCLRVEQVLISSVLMVNLSAWSIDSPTRATVSKLERRIREQRVLLACCSCYPNCPSHPPIFFWKMFTASRYGGATSQPFELSHFFSEERGRKAEANSFICWTHIITNIRSFSSRLCSSASPTRQATLVVPCGCKPALMVSMHAAITVFSIGQAKTHSLCVVPTDLLSATGSDHVHSLLQVFF